MGGKRRRTGPRGRLRGGCGRRPAYQATGPAGPNLPEGHHGARRDRFADWADRAGRQQRAGAGDHGRRDGLLVADGNHLACALDRRGVVIAPDTPDAEAPGPGAPDADTPGAGAPDAGGTVELLNDTERPGAWTLLIDGILQSEVDLGNPRHLEIEYMRRLGHLADLAGPAGMPLRALHLGGGALTLARYVAATRPGSQQLAVESNATVAALVSQRLPLIQAGRTQPSQTQPGHTRPGRTRPGAGEIGVLVADARAALEQLPNGSFDLLVVDVFAGARTPAHLTSVEFTAAGARVLGPSGIYAVNVGDGPPLAHARGRVAAVRSVFAHVCVLAEPPVLHGRRFGNLVVVASDRELPVSGLIRRIAADPFPARLVEGAELDQFVAGRAPIVDAHAEPSPAMPPEVFA
ncbi:MAG: fused MFS/spermidine synthase [Actinobacteria bacterium]|nr:fused MFS/spermidine synthase [Actinomycetota bacterium]